MGPCGDVPGGESRAEAVVRFRNPRKPWRVLAPQLAAGGVEARAGAVQDDHHASIVPGADSLIGGADNQVGPILTVQIAGGQGATEPVTNLIDTWHTRRVLRPHPTTRGGETGHRTQQHMNQASVSHRAEILSRHTDHQIRFRASADICCRQGRPEEIMRLRRAGDPVRGLAPHLRVGH
jgi:hypothetical protein